MWGDSHVRRLSQFRHLIDDRLNDCTLTFMGIGGATIPTLVNRSDAVVGFHVVCIMIGGNDLANGISLHSVIQGYEYLAQIVINRGVETVLFTSIWPRNNRWFNHTCRRLADIMHDRYLRHRRIVYWIWDRRQPMALCDGVHLTIHGYRRGVLYLLSALLWTLRHL